MNASEPGRLLSGRYRLARVIGRGGMGIVWQGHDVLLDRDVAVKEIVWPPYLTESEQQLACRRATREAQMAGRLSHHNVVRIYDIVEEDGHPFIVMEFLPYRSLRDLIAEDGPLPPARAAEVGLGVLAALRAAHAEGILHRDVKPGNILVGTDGRVVLTDFGIARAADSPTLTGTGMLLGSPAYIAPERARGGKAGEASAPGDMWGLGASLYAAVEGHPPFERDSALATLTAVVVDEPAEPARAGPLAPVISGLLRKDPQQRYDAATTDWLLRQVATADEPLTAAAAAGQDVTVAEAGGPGADAGEAGSAKDEAAGNEAAGNEAAGNEAAGNEARAAGAAPVALLAAPAADLGPALEAEPETPADLAPVAQGPPAGPVASAGAAPPAGAGGGTDGQEPGAPAWPRSSRGTVALLAALIVIAAGVTLPAVRPGPPPPPPPRPRAHRPPARRPRPRHRPAPGPPGPRPPARPARPQAGRAVTAHCPPATTGSPTRPASLSACPTAGRSPTRAITST